MYFIPEKGRFYRWAVHTKPLHRYMLTFGFLFLISCLWFVVINPWLTGLLQYEQAALHRAGQQRVEECVAERIIAQRDFQQEKLSKELSGLLAGHSEQKQLAFVFDTAQKANLAINSFTHEKEKRKEWRTKEYKSLSAVGTFDQCMQFLAALQSSPHMIQCKQLALQRAESNCSFQCQLEFISCDQLEHA